MPKPRSSVVYLPNKNRKKLQLMLPFILAVILFLNWQQSPHASTLNEGKPRLDALDSILPCLWKTGAQIITQKSQEFEMARRARNADVDRKPLAVALPTSTSQVQGLQRCCRQLNTQSIPRSGRHGHTGASVADGAVIIDVSNINAVSVDAKKEIATVGGGANLGAVYRAAYLASEGMLAPVGGTCPSVGIAGFLLGGGTGLLSRYAGTGCDRMLSLEMVMHDGRVLEANATHNTDLFWASCGGGGGNFGIATSFTISLVKVPQNWTFYSFRIRAPEHELQSLMHWQEWVNLVDPRLASEVLVELDEIHVYGIYIGKPDELLRALNAHDVLNNPRYNTTEPWMVTKSWLNTVMEFDPSYGLKHMAELSRPTNVSDGRLSMKITSFLPTKLLNKEAMQLLIDWKRSFKPTDVVYVNLQNRYSQGGLKKLAVTDTAFPHRNCRLGLALEVHWNPSDSETRTRLIERLEEAKTKLQRYDLQDAAYVNYLDLDVPNALEAYYGPNLGRLKAVKAKYDPFNVFTQPVVGIPLD